MPYFCSYEWSDTRTAPTRLTLAVGEISKSVKRRAKKGVVGVWIVFLWLSYSTPSRNICVWCISVHVCVEATAGTPLPHGTSLPDLLFLSVVILPSSFSSHDDTCVTPPGALWVVAMVTATGSRPIRRQSGPSGFPQGHCLVWGITGRI